MISIASKSTMALNALRFIPIITSLLLMSFNKNGNNKYDFYYTYFRYLPNSLFSEGDFETSSNWVRVYTDNPLLCDGEFDPCTVRINSLDLPVISGLLDTQLFAIRLSLITTITPYYYQGEYYTNATDFVYAQSISKKN